MLLGDVKEILLKEMFSTNRKLWGSIFFFISKYFNAEKAYLVFVVFFFFWLVCQLSLNHHTKIIHSFFGSYENNSGFCHSECNCQ